jgi:hypothetical protein
VADLPFFGVAKFSADGLLGTDNLFLALDGEIDLGDVELDNRPAEELWRSLKSRNPDMGKRTRYQLFVGNEQIHWTDLPKDHVVFPVVTRESICHSKDLNSSPSHGWSVP